MRMMMRRRRRIEPEAKVECYSASVTEEQVMRRMCCKSKAGS